MNTAVIIALVTLALIVAYVIYSHLAQVRTAVGAIAAHVGVDPSKLPPALQPKPTPATTQPTAAEPPAAAAPATPAPVAAPAPATPVNPFIAWKAQGFTLESYLFHIGRALSDDEWAQAIAAGYTKDSGPVAAPAAPAIDFSAPVLDFATVAGQNMPVAGTVSKKYTGCPTPTWVEVANGSGSTLTANGASHAEPNGQALNRLTVTPDLNGEINVTVVCDTGGRTTLTVLAAPQ